MQLPKKFWSRFSAIILILSILISGYFTLWNTHWSDGDEVHYLIMASSWINDRDFDLNNDYESKEYFSHHGVEVDRHGVEGIDGAFRSHHNVLLPILIAPGYARKNIFGARLIIWVICLLGLFSLIKFQHLLGINKNTSQFVAAIYAIQLPILAYSQYAYTDLVSGYFMLWGLWPILAYILAKKRPTRPWLLLLGSTVFGISVFLHVKLIQFGFLFLLAAWTYLSTNGFKNWQLKKLNPHWPRFLAYLFGPFAILSLAFSYKMYRWFGMFRPDAAHKQILMGVEAQSSFYQYNPVKILHNIIGIFIDGDSGLLINAPIFILLFAGIYLWYRHSRSTFWIIVIPSILLIIRQAMFIKWASWGPPARYLMVFLPPLVPAIAFTVQRTIHSIFTKVSLLLILAWTFFINYSFFITGRGGYGSFQGFNPYLSELFPNSYQLFTTNLITPETVDYFKGGLILIILGLSTYVFLKIDQKNSSS